jgi:hypothetical protein
LIPKIVGGMSSGFMLLLESIRCHSSSRENKPNECAEMKDGYRDLVRCEEDRRQGIDTVKGEVLHIEEGKICGAAILR